MSVPPPIPDAPLPVLGHLPSRWNPPADGVTLHSGEQLPSGRIYLAGPPLEIGSVRSAHSNMEEHKGAEAQTGKRIGSAFGGFFLGGFIVWILGVKVGLWGFTEAPMWVLGISGVIGAVVGFVSAKPKYETSYIGEHGIASYKYGGRGATIGKADVFSFARGDILQVQQTRNYYNGVYTGTTYNFVWNNAAGKPEHRIMGTHKSKEGNPPTEDPYWYGIAAENAWSRFRLPALRDQLARGETVFFPVRGKGAVGVSRQGLTIQIGGKQEMVPMNAIGNLGINNGEVTITRIGAKKGFLGIGADGVYKFPYSGLGNARLFLALLAEVIGQEAPVADGDLSTDATNGEEPRHAQPA